MFRSGKTPMGRLKTSCLWYGVLITLSVYLKEYYFQVQYIKHMLSLFNSMV